jgi:imidazolonepropionase-like amidohydrolase
VRAKRLLLILAACLPGVVSADAVHWTNGRWFDGQRFAETSFYTVDGRLTKRRPPQVDRVVDLAGRYVVPPFGDAHHHGIDSAQGLDAKIRAFMDAGVFYVKNPNVIPDLLTTEVRAKLNTPSSIDVAFANGGLTRPNGHPVRLHAMLAKRGVFPGIGPEQMDGRAYFTIADTAELDAKWPAVLAGRPDFIKTFVLFSGTPRAEGLDPDVLAEVVRRAHAAGLRVSSHIETAADFRVAVEAGVDEISHLPIPRPGLPSADYDIDPATAKLAARKGVTVVTTVRPLRMPGMPPTMARQLTNEAANVAVLRAAGVAIAIGSDGISGEQPFATARDEALYLHRHKFADNLTLLKMWAETTPRTIFPERRIGRLEEGFEGSFLVLEGDPLADFGNVAKIALKVKQGIQL